MQDFVGRTAAGRYEYGNRSEDLARALETIRDLCVRCAPSVALFTAFCVAWAVVFGVALR